MTRTPKTTASQRRRCAIYTRKSSEEGLEQTFNSLDAQREACEAYIQSQRHEGWQASSTLYDDGGFSGGTIERPALSRLIADIKAEGIEIVVVYKVDRLSRSLADFVRLVDLFDEHGVSFVSVTQQFNTSTSMGRLTLNVLLSFAQFEREVTGERIRDKIAASKQKGMWMGGVVPLGYLVKDKQLVVNEREAGNVRHIFERYLELGCVRRLKEALDVSVEATANSSAPTFDKSFSRGALYNLLKNPIYIGKVRHAGTLYPGQHKRIVDEDMWRRVQEKLAQNQSATKHRTKAKDPSLLAGLLFDDRGYPMSPSHATKGSRRYRYYVSQAILQYRERDAGTVARVRAQAVEDVVVKRIHTLLTRPDEVLGMFPDTTAPQKEHLLARAKAVSRQWPEAAPAQQIEWLSTLVETVTVSRDQLTIVVSHQGLTNVLLGDRAKTDGTPAPAMENTVINIPMNLKRCGIEKRLVIPASHDEDAHPTTVHALQSALAKALRWNQALIDGEVASMTMLAKKEHVTQRYIAHLIKLAFLAPDIMDAIIGGRLPTSLSLEQLKKGFPLDWDAQRKLLGFLTS